MIEIIKERNSMYSFVLNTSEGYSIFKSVTFSSIKEVKKQLKHLQISQENELFFERKTNTSGDFQFDLLTSQGLLIGNSHNYQSEAGMENGIKNMKQHLLNLQKI